MQPSLHFLRCLLSRVRHGPALLALLAGPHAIVALVPALAAALFAHHGATWALAAAAITPLLMALRGALRQEINHRARVAFFAHVSEAFASRAAIDARRAGPHRLESMLFGASYTTTRMMSDDLPVLAGSAAATLLLIPLLFALVPWQLVVIGAPAAASAVLGFWLLKRVLSRRVSDMNERAQALMDAASVLLRGHADLLATARAQRQAQAVAQAAEAYSTAVLRSERAGSLTGRVPLLAAAVVAVLLAWPWLSANRDVLTAHVASGLALASVVSVVSGLARSFGGVVKGLRELAPLIEILEAPADTQTAVRGKSPDFDGIVRVHNVTFAYDGAADTTEAGTAVLRNLSLVWRPGEVLAITGPNGSGKTTLLRLLLRLADPREGSVFVGTDDLRALDVSAWREGIAYLPQRPHLPESATLGEVHGIFGPDVAPERLVEALRDVGLLNKLERLHPSHPLATVVGELSSGERQRFALARTLAHPGTLLILDEPDANLDAAGLEVLIQALPRLVSTRRVLLVAHEPRLLACATRAVRVSPTSEARKSIAVRDG